VLVCPGLHYGLAPPDMFEYFSGADHADPWVNPAAADRATLRSLPPTLVLTAGDDQWEGGCSCTSQCHGLCDGCRHAHGQISTKSLLVKRWKAPA
jgi:hypothetical protein